jgi:hypothetical protein
VEVDVRNSYKMFIVDLTDSRRNNTNTILRCTLIDFLAGISFCCRLVNFIYILCNIKEVLLDIKSFLSLFWRKKNMYIYYMTCWLVISYRRFGGACLHLRIVQKKLVAWKYCLHYTRKEKPLLTRKSYSSSPTWKMEAEICSEIVAIDYQSTRRNIQ